VYHVNVFIVSVKLRKIPSFIFCPVEVSTITGIIHCVLLLAFLLSDIRIRLVIVIVNTMLLNDWIVLRYTNYYSLLLPPQYLPADNQVELYNIGNPSRDQSLAEKILDELNFWPRRSWSDLGS
jgi:hypothetical protein